VDTTFIETAKACLVNGKRLLFDALILSDPLYDTSSDPSDKLFLFGLLVTEENLPWKNLPWKPTSLALAILAEEEFAKGFLLFLVGQKIIPWSHGVRRAARDHSCKHLLSALMEYANPDTDQMRASNNRVQASLDLLNKMTPLYQELSKLREETLHLDAARYIQERKPLDERLNALWNEVERLKQEDEKEESFSPLVADAINILRYAKVGFWEGGYGYDEEVDSGARAIAETRDREKQRALYIEVGKNGAVCSRPEQVQKDIIAQAFDRSKKLGLFLQELLEHGGWRGQFKRLIENLKVMFASQEELLHVIPKE
jgi:hypothetical protein